MRRDEIGVRSGPHGEARGGEFWSSRPPGTSREGVMNMPRKVRWVSWEGAAGDVGRRYKDDTTRRILTKTVIEERPSRSFRNP